MKEHVTLAALHARLRNRRVTYGSWLQLPSVDVAEILADGFDWLVVDMEHGGVNRETMVGMVRVIEAKGRLPIVRLMTGDPLLGRQALDAGCAGLIIPHVSDARSLLLLYKSLRNGWTS